jgi:hypothetical protein
MKSTHNPNKPKLMQAGVDQGSTYIHGGINLARMKPAAKPINNL